MAESGLPGRLCAGSHSYACAPLGVLLPRWASLFSDMSSVSFSGEDERAITNALGMESYAVHSNLCRP